MSSGWTAPGSTDDTSPGGEGHDAGATSPWADGPAPAPGRQDPEVPRRELVQITPLFPLRPLGVGEVLGAAVRIYRLRPKTVLGLAAAVYGIAFLLTSLATGASLVPVISDTQAILDDPTAEVTGAGSTSDLLLTLGSSLAAGLITLIAASVVTVAITRVALGEATGDHVSSEQMWSSTRRAALPAMVVSVLVSVAVFALVAVGTSLGALPLLLGGEVTWIGVVAVLLGLVIGALAGLWLWGRTILAIPAVVVEELGILGSLRRSLALTRGAALWRPLGLSLLVYVLYILASQIVAGLGGLFAGVLFAIILLATGGSGIVVAMIVLTAVTYLITYLITVLLAPFLSAATVTVYADHRMRHEAWDIDLTRRARQNWSRMGTA